MLRVFLVLFLTSALAPAQTREPDDSWLMQNYRFAPAPAPGEVKPVSPTVARLQEVLQTTLSILHKANHEGDYEAALAAAAQATGITQLLGTLAGEVGPPQPQRPAGVPIDAPVATRVWTDRWMLHYLTPEGGHVQIRLDRIDWKRQCELTPDVCRTTPATPPAPRTSRPVSTAARVRAPNR
jgi:hypothetical protein